MAGVAIHRKFGCWALVAGWMALGLAAALPAQETIPPGAVVPGAAGPNGASGPKGPAAGGEQPVVDIQVIGNQRSRLTELPRLNTRTGQPFDPQAVAEDVRAMAKSHRFIDVHSETQQVAGGVVVIFRVIERPIMHYIKYLGNVNIADRTLKKQTELEVDKPLDPYAVQDGARKIEQFYKDHGYNHVQVTIQEGNRIDDRGVVYIIHEGPLERVWWVNFTGNTIASSARLRTFLQEKPGFAWVFKGYFDRRKIDEDTEKLTGYYRSLGFFEARIGHEIEFDEEGKWTTINYTINEGPRAQIRNIVVMGNQKFTTEQVTKYLKLKPKDFFNQSTMDCDLAAMRDVYGGHGYIFANIEADTCVLDEQPGVVDIRYKVVEGDVWRVGKINVHISGDDPHTRMSVILNRMSLRPGDIVDTRKIRADERRVKAAGVFLTDPTKGTVPKIVFSKPPGLDGDKDSSIADRAHQRRGNAPDYRGQSPDGDTKEHLIDLDVIEVPQAQADAAAASATQAAATAAANGQKPAVGVPAGWLAPRSMRVSDEFAQPQAAADKSSGDDAVAGNGVGATSDGSIPTVELAIGSSIPAKRNLVLHNTHATYGGRMAAVLWPDYSVCAVQVVGGMPMPSLPRSREPITGGFLCCGDDDKNDEIGRLFGPPLTLDAGLTDSAIFERPDLSFQLLATGMPFSSHEEAGLESSSSQRRHNRFLAGILAEAPPSDGVSPENFWREERAASADSRTVVTWKEFRTGQTFRVAAEKFRFILGAWPESSQFAISFTEPCLLEPCFSLSTSVAVLLEGLDAGQVFGSFGIFSRVDSYASECIVGETIGLNLDSPEIPDQTLGYAVRLANEVVFMRAASDANLAPAADVLGAAAKPAAAPEKFVRSPVHGPLVYRGQSPGYGYSNGIPPQNAYPAYGSTPAATGPDSGIRPNYGPPAPQPPPSGYYANPGQPYQPPANAPPMTGIAPTNAQPRTAYYQQQGAYNPNAVAPVVQAPAPTPFFGGQPYPQSPLYAPPMVDSQFQIMPPMANSVDLDAIAEENQTGRIMFGVSVNTDAGLVGNVLLEEQNFDYTRFPTSWEDLRSGQAFRGAGQKFRIEAAPGTEVSRYAISFTEPYLMGTPVAFNSSVSYFTRQYDNWDERRVGGRIGLGYQLPEIPDLTIGTALRAERIHIANPTPADPPELNAVLGYNDLYGVRFNIKHDTRDNAFLPTEGHVIDVAFEQVFGTWTYSRETIDARQYFLLGQRPDGSGRHTLSVGTHIGFSGNATPVYDRFFAGGYSTIRGFAYRGASPTDQGVEVGGDFQFLNTVEYMFPITAGDALRGVVFCDFGTVEQNVTINANDFRVAPGFGLRIAIPALGPAPIALDIAIPVTHAPGDRIQNFSFSVGTAF